MTNLNFSKTLIVLTLVAVLGFGANAFAQGGRGYGRGMGYGPGWSNEPGMGDGPGMGYGRGMGRGFGRSGYASDLSEEALKKLNDERAAFFGATKDLRNDIFQKRLELRSELAKQNPDTKNAEKLQKEVSELEARFDQKRINHRVKMKKINPNAGQGFGGRGRGFGTGFGGPCWR